MRASSVNQSQFKTHFALKKIESAGQSWLPPAVELVWNKFSPWFWGIVIFPAIISAAYFFIIASDRYMSETRFIVRSQNQQSQSVLGQILQSTGMQSSSDGASAVRSFITSREAVKALEARENLRFFYSRPEADFVTRFPGLFSGSSFEQLYKHYLNYIDATLDAGTGVTTLQVEAYTPTDAQKISQALLNASEQLVNRLNARAEADAVGSANRQVLDAERKLADVEQRLTTYRYQQQILDPKLTSGNIYSTLGGLMSARAATAAQLAELNSSSPQSPSIPALNARLRALDGQMAVAMASVTGSQNSVAGKLAQYGRLSLEEEIDSKLLASATQSLEAARVEARSKHLYIEHISEPNLPDYPLYPMKIIDFCISVVTFLLIYGIAWLLRAAVREHGDA